MTATQPYQITVCDDTTSVFNAAETLRACSRIALDCEGRSLGEKDGCLSVISLCAIPSTTEQGVHVYLIDVMTVGADALLPIFDILRSREHVKIMFDGRMDWAELYHRHGVQLAHVLDLQLADVESRGRRGEGMNEQLRRLSPFCHRTEVEHHSDCYRMIHRLNGMEFSAKEHLIIGTDDDVKPKFFPHQSWTDRPLREGFLHYAATDMMLIAQLYARFVSMGYIEEYKLFEQSERYISLYKSSPPRPGSGHPLLPLEILACPSGFKRLITCVSCSRSLSLDCFSKACRSSGRKANCWVCRAMNVRQTRQSQIQASLERDDEDYWDDDED